MTTEVLRNMLLAGSDLLEGLHTVVLDEVHFIQDPYRGGVWEEVLVLAPPEIRFVCLSATVNNANELGAWLRSVRGDTAVIVERSRPIVLRHHFVVHRREDDEILLIPLLGDDGRPGGEGLRIDQAVRRALQGRPAHWAPRGRGPRLPYRAPLRTEILEELRYLEDCCRPSCSSSAGPRATTPFARWCATGCASPTRGSGPPSGPSLSVARRR